MGEEMKKLTNQQWVEMSRAGHMGRQMISFL
jgi:hypothetical protein